MSGIVSFDDLFPLKANPTALDRVFGFDSGDGKSRGFTIQAILDLIDEVPVTWAEITGKPPVFPAEAHTIGSHSNVAGTVDSAADGTFLKKVGGQIQAVAVDFYGVTNPPPPDPSVPEAARLITALKTAQWDQAFGWGNHAGQYRPVAWVPAWGDVTGKPVTFAPSAHTLVSHSDAAALATATAGQLVRKAAVGFDAFTPDYFSPFNPPPPDASIPDFVRNFTIGQFAGYEAKMLEFSELPDGAVPLIKNGVPADSQLMGIYTENPFDPVTEEEDYNAFVEELLYLISTKRIKGVAGVDADDYVTKAQLDAAGGGGGGGQSIGAYFDGMGSVVYNGSKVFIRVKSPMTITGYSIIAEGTSPTCELDIKRIASGTVLPSSSIVASAPPALSTGNAIKSTTLTGWSTSLLANDILEISIVDCLNATKINFTLYP